MEASYEIADHVELIHPARFLFNAGGTPKQWNEKMLADPHFKVLFHEQNSASIFPNTDIMGGLVVSFHDTSKNYGAIEVYTPFEELNQILRKIKNQAINSPFSSIIHNRGLFRFSNKIYEDYPEQMKKFSDSRIGSSSFERLPDLFLKDKPDDVHEYIQIFGLSHNSREYRWFRKDYTKDVECLKKFKVFVPKANGSGALGGTIPTSVIGQPVIGLPNIGHTETFLSIGSFETQCEADACMKYIKSKFARAMLGVLKITQDNSAEKWKYVPLQDFTPQSDIDWSRAIPDIDRQLYRKYGLSEDEIAFIESHVKEMT